MSIDFAKANSSFQDGIAQLGKRPEVKEPFKFQLLQGLRSLAAGLEALEHRLARIEGEIQEMQKK